MIGNDKCPVCLSGSIRDFLFRRNVPVHQNLLIKDRHSAINVPRGDLDLAVCEECGFVFNRAFDPNRLQYGPAYENAQYHSPSFDDYLSDLANHIVSERNVRNSNIVEVGCGQGYFLRKLVEYPGAENVGFGFDPSYQGELIQLDGRLRFERCYYDETCANVPADVVISRHVIEHVPDPLKMLRTIKAALVNSKDARIFCETPCVEWILRGRVIWDFFYEHCSYFTATSLATAFEVAGFKVESVQHVFEGQYLWLEATLADEENNEIRRTPGPVLRLAGEFARCEQQMKDAWREKIKEMAALEKIALWGAGAKGVTFANLIDQQANYIDSIVDVNPQKQGCFVPGTGHSIIGPEGLEKRGIATAILMNPNYRDENLALLRQSGLEVRLIEKI